MEKGYGIKKKYLLFLTTIVIILIGIILFCLLYLKFGNTQLLSHIVGELIAAVDGLFEKRQELRQFIMDFGAFAPLVFIILQASQVVISPIPGEATGFIGGFIFGLPAFFYSTIGLSLGSVCAFMIARYFRSLIRGYVEKSQYYMRFERMLERQGLLVTFILFLLPGFPKDFLCYFLGLSKMPWEIFLALSAVGRMPGTLMLTFQGADLFEGRFLRLLLVAAFSILLIVPLYIKRDNLYKWVEKRL